MKTALVLGLALAANAYKTEQVETTVHIKGNNLHLNDLKDLIPHGIKFDDQADDEMFVAPHQEPEKLWKHNPYILYDDQADDEYMALPKEYFDLFKNHKFPIELQALRVDDELATLPYKDYTGLFKNLPKITVPIEHQTQQADDELATLPYNVPYFKKFPMWELQSDDEFLATGHFGALGSNHPGVVYLDDETDNEFAARHHQEHQVKGPNSRVPSRPSRPTNSHQGSSKWEAPKQEYPTTILGSDNPGLYFLDDEAENELVYLKDLLKPDRHRPIDIALPRDDELRLVEKAPRFRGGEVGRKDHTIILP